MNKQMPYSKEKQIRTVDCANRVNIAKSVLEEINFDKKKHIFIVNSQGDNEIILTKASIHKGGE